MKIAAVVVAAAGLIATGAVHAQAGEDLLKKAGCTACHANDKKVVGPAYVDVAAKYKGDAGAAAKLADKVKKGGSGVYGPVPMPPNPAVSDADLKTLALGFRYPLETLMASAVCRKVSTRAERLGLYEQLVNPTSDFTLLRVQEQIATDLNATCNLLKLDPSGALVFQYLKDYPFSKNEFFRLGMEIAAKIFFGLSLELAKDLGDDSWLKNDYSRPSYLPPD